MKTRLLLPLALLLIPCAGHATLAKALDLEGLATRADEVVRGTVVRQGAGWDGRYIVTDTEVLVTECLKGACRDALVTVRALGGTVDGITMQHSGTVLCAMFSPAEALGLS